MNPYFITALCFVAMLGGLSLTLWIFLDDSRKQNLALLDKYKPYKKKSRVMTPNEMKLYKTICSFPSLSDYQIFPQIPYSALMEVDSNLFDLGERFYQINAYRSDFVICDKENSTPLVVVELDDSRHFFYPRTEARDRFVHSALRIANIPLISFRTKDLIDKEYLENCILKELSRARRV